jgi:hypothetical protein
MSRADPSETLSRSVHGSGVAIVSIGRTINAREQAGRTLACDLIGADLTFATPSNKLIERSLRS